MAIRTLTTTSSLDEALGFGGDKSGTLTIQQAGDASLTLEIGGETYGSKDRYLRYNDVLYLVDDKHLRSVSSAKARLVERRVHPLGEKEIERVSIVYGDQQTSLVQKTQTTAPRRTGRVKAKPTQIARLGHGGKLFRLEVQSYEESTQAELLSDFRVVVEGKGQTWNIEVLKTEADSNPDYYAKSFNQGLVKLTSPSHQTPPKT